jgi:hypothetical protein
MSDTDKARPMDVVITLLFNELRKAEEKFPGWPEDIVHGAAIMVEEAGETIQAALDCFYGRGGKEKVIKEAAHTGAMVIRLLLSLTKEQPHDAKKL